MKYSAPAPLLLALLAACGADPKSETAQLAEDCGVKGPVLLLPLSDDQRPRGLFSFLEVDERLLFVLRSSDGEVEGEFKPLPERGSVYTVGRCGEDPRVIGPDIDSAFTSPHFPGAVFGCHWQTDDLVRLDPTGEAAPEAVHAAKCSAASFTEHGLVAYDPALGTSFYPTLDAAAATFGEPIALPDHYSWRPGGTGRTVLADEILYMDENFDLLRVSLPDLATSVVLEDVQFWDISDDGRYLMTQGFVIGEGATEEVYIHDRQEGRSVTVGRSEELHESGSRFVSPDYAIVKSGDGLQRVVELPDLATYEIPDQYGLRSPIPDGRWLAVLDGAWFLLDLDDESKDMMVTDRDGTSLARTNEYVDLRVKEPGSMVDEVPLIRFFFDPAREPVQLAPRVSVYGFFQDDGRIVTPVEVDESGLGGLVVVDPEDPKERRIDEHVVGAGGPIGRYPGQPDVLVYAVVDGERTGVWAAQLAPRDQE